MICINKMSEELNACERCGKMYKGKRGLSIHLKTCEGVKNLVCEYCNKDFSSVYSLSIHMTRCSDSLKHQQNQEKLVKSEIQKLQEKLKETELTLQQERKELEQRHKQELKDLNKKVRAEYEQQLKMRDDDLKSFYNELNSSKQSLQEKDKQMQQLERELNDKKVDYRTILDLYGKLSMKDTNTMIIQDNRVQLQSLDPSMIQGRIEPPDYVVGTVNDLVRMLRSLGVRNCFRVNDKSRGTLSWNKPGEGEIRDPTGDLLLSHIIESLDSDLTKEKCYYEEELKKLCQADEQDQYLINEAQEFVSFCTSLLKKDPNILKEIKKQLVKQGRVKGDTEIDEIREVSYNKFINSITKSLFPNIFKWNEKTFFELGRFLGANIKDYYHIEGASREELYIVIHSDGNTRKQIFSDKLMEYISDSIKRLIDNKTLEHLLSEALLHEPKNKERAEKMSNYILCPTLDETKEIMRGIVSV
jgi:hypothetical protein